MKVHNPEIPDLFCPKCGSKNISSNMSIRTIAGGSVQNEHQCNDCGYKGMFFPLKK